MPDQETSPTISTTEIVRHLWRFRFYFFLLPPVFLVASYLYVRAFLGETFESTAMLLIRAPASIMAQGEPRLNTFDPPVYVDFLKSDEVLHDVISSGREKFPEEFRGDFEKLRRLFKVDVVMTRDTSVQATYSPVLQLSVQAGNREVVKWLADEWIRRIVEKYGTLRMRQAQQIRELGARHYEEYSQSVLTLQEQEVATEQLLDALDLRLDANARILLGTTGGTVESPGLYEQQVREQIALAGGDSGASVARQEKIDALIASIEEQNTELGGRKAKVMAGLEKIRKDLVSARMQLETARDVYTNPLVDAAELSDPLNPDSKGDLIILSRPVLPEVRIAPPRTVLAAVIAVFLTGLVAIVLVLNLYLKRSVLGARS